MPDVPPPVYPSPAPARRRRSLFGWFGNILATLVIVLSLLLNLFFFWALSNVGEGGSLSEKHYSGNKLSRNKIAIVRIEGALMEGMTGYFHKEIAQAAADSAVKAVVVRVNSPGGTITASDDLYKRLTDLRDGDPEKKTSPKPLVVSMASIAASGAYYISMPAKTILAEPTTATGSIGVYASLPDVTELSKKIGFNMRVIKDGDLKYSGSPFTEMSAHERQMWQDMIDHSYLQFLQVVEQGRPSLKGKLQEDIPIRKDRPIRSGKERSRHVEFTRYRADGGIWTSDEAKQYGLIDQIGYLDDAIKIVRQSANLGDDYHVILYERPIGLLTTFLDVKARPPQVSLLDPERLSNAAVPRVWYLWPQADLAGILAGAGQRSGD
jgi:protease IV